MEAQEQKVQGHFRHRSITALPCSVAAIPGKTTLFFLPWSKIVLAWCEAAYFCRCAGLFLFFSAGVNSLLLRGALISLCSGLNSVPRVPFLLLH